MLKHKSWALIEFSLLLWSLSPMALLLARDEVSFIARRDLWLGGALNSVVVGDFNGDARTDLAVANEMINSVFILLGNGDGTFDNGDGTFGPARDFEAGNLPGSIALGDFNEDKIQDLAVAATLDSVFLLFGRGDGTFESAQNFGAGNGPYAIALGDLDSDDRLDLMIVNTDSNSVSILLNNTPQR